jgi:hypothetical protein
MHFSLFEISQTTDQFRFVQFVSLNFVNLKNRIMCKNKGAIWIFAIFVVQQAKMYFKQTMMTFKFKAVILNVNNSIISFFITHVTAL